MRRKKISFGKSDATKLIPQRKKQVIVLDIPIIKTQQPPTGRFGLKKFNIVPTRGRCRYLHGLPMLWGLLRIPMVPPTQHHVIRAYTLGRNRNGELKGPLPSTCLRCNLFSVSSSRECVLVFVCADAATFMM